jgi:hypothetical protein
MTAKEWKAKGEAAAEVVELALPSGMVITARRPGPMQFAAWDRLPLMLGRLDNSAEMGTEETVEVAGFVRELVIYCCVAPRVSMSPSEDEIAPRDIPEADWQYIMRWAMRLEEAEAVRRFRRIGADDNGGDRGEAVFVPPVGADGDRGSGAGAGIRPGGMPAVDGAREGRE